MTQKELEAIRERCERATPGPWYSIKKYFYTVFSTGKNGDKIILTTLTLEDTLFVTQARTDIPALLDYIKELEARISKKEEVHDDVWLGWANRKGGEEK